MKTPRFLQLIIVRTALSSLFVAARAVMPIPRADLALRREVLVLFELCGVDPSTVVFMDEVDLSALQVRSGHYYDI